ncbi:hypothetical protein [Parvularcula sp. LCG005]|uniref:hypothetical protein n=1 Tax=Parvularcula sp. LCG005 TaxID=3078805 RepID=UPI0029434046|nr:hypothetical protein [Parvularcula sp. LCG005]WOI51978.1 hypothetical protein RUI03_07390 [Parvularcula sp. LCG005]
MSERDEPRKSLSLATMGILVAMVTQVAITLIWVGKITEAVDGLKIATENIAQTDDIVRLERRIDRASGRVDALEARIFTMASERNPAHAQQDKRLIP